jgi:hypothetical protein
MISDRFHEDAGLDGNSVSTANDRRNAEIFSSAEFVDMRFGSKNEEAVSGFYLVTNHLVEGDVKRTGWAVVRVNVETPGQLLACLKLAHRTAPLTRSL